MSGAYFESNVATAASLMAVLRSAKARAFSDRDLPCPALLATGLNT